MAATSVYSPRWNTSYSIICSHSCVFPYAFPSISDESILILEISGRFSGNCMFHDFSNCVQHCENPHTCVSNLSVRFRAAHLVLQYAVRKRSLKASDHDCHWTSVCQIQKRSVKCLRTGSPVMPVAIFTHNRGVHVVVFLPVGVGNLWFGLGNAWSLLIGWYQQYWGSARKICNRWNTQIFRKTHRTALACRVLLDFNNNNKSLTVLNSDHCLPLHPFCGHTLESIGAVHYTAAPLRGLTEQQQQHTHTHTHHTHTNKQTKTRTHKQTNKKHNYIFNFQILQWCFQVSWIILPGLRGVSEGQIIAVQTLRMTVITDSAAQAGR